MKYQHRVLGMLSLLSVITYLDRLCIAVAGPRMQDAMHISPEAWGWVTSVFFLSYSAFEIPTGALGDRIGPQAPIPMHPRLSLGGSRLRSARGPVGNRMDDQSGRRGVVAPPRRADSNSLWLAGALFRVRSPGDGVERGVVRVVSGLAAGESRGHRGRTARDRF